MTERTLKRLLVALAALVVVYVGARAASAVTRSDGGGGSLGAMLERVRADSLAGLVAVSPAGQRVELRRNGSAWTVDGFPADSSAVDRLVRASSALEVVDLVARSPETHPRLGVSADSAWDVELRGQQGTVRLLVGRMGREYANSYVRLPDQDEVYEVRGDLRGAVTIPRDDWRDKTILRLDTARVRTLSIERNRARYELTRADSLWRLGGGRADSTRVRDVLAGLARLSAAGFVADTTTFSGRETRRLVALGQSGDTLARIEFAGDSTNWLARVPGRAQLYRMSGYSVDRLTPTRQDVGRR